MRTWVRGLATLVVAVLAMAGPAAAQGGPRLVLLGGSVTEGDSGVVKALFDVTMIFDPKLVTCQPSTPGCSAKTVDVCVDFTTVDDSASSPQDYEERGGSLNTTVTLAGEEGEIPVGSIEVDVKGDSIDEPDETFKGRLSLGTGCEHEAGLGVAEAVMTIVDDDGPAAPPAAPEVAINDVTIREGDEGSRKVAFTISLSRPVVGIASVSYRSASGTATGLPTGDYLPVQGTVTFKRFSTSQQVLVTVRGDSSNEANETFTVELQKATGATIVDATGVGTIVDDD